MSVGFQQNNPFVHLQILHTSIHFIQCIETNRLLHYECYSYHNIHFVVVLFPISHCLGFRTTIGHVSWFAHRDWLESFSSPAIRNTKIFIRHNVHTALHTALRTPMYFFFRGGSRALHKDE